ncbi:2-methoxy-6-polyprenyl-1,4-benzoquinol methylase, mitochondrial [Gracilariopsis chorda]|uniref:2-methoxy-6-polyprenyl-1,4-benzoquinol methylase, mitochondrial n=1 Tax=Gracilariopsis chorda TaxID=448386 RepID=A0A2V3IKY1_9FLOR|nr:2-methoxy-6-polyprenyl-1,4-benzoquinol methylase, mitochondrial [Gracilariopsis chorda]|eukprot:PXF42741.1 2-methoxy-6-polyprenyl-1,4-benzoquinol methylase, mitochondrial [Gracilariopsis chorda]
MILFHRIQLIPCDHQPRLHRPWRHPTHFGFGCASSTWSRSWRPPTACPSCTAPRARFLMREFAAVHHPMLRSLYDAYSFNVIPRIGQLVARDRHSYQYLVESISAFPPQHQFADMIKHCGFRHVTVTDYTGAIGACYSAFKPPQ